MNPNRFLGITSFGESHGPFMGVVIEDVKPGISFPSDQLRELLARRKPGNGEFSSPRNEQDDYQIISGVLDGRTTGMPICILFPNRDARSEDYEPIRDVFRPGHADYTLFHKFKIYDYRGGGHLSGRETICRVAASALVADITASIDVHFKIIHPTYKDELQKLKAQGDTSGGILEITVSGLMAGLGDPVFEKLDANLGKALLSIGGVKGIEFGDGFLLGIMTGSQANDAMTSSGFASNHCGGILGGISTGEPIVIRLAIKPVSSISQPQQTIRHDGSEVELTLTSRSDVCLIQRIQPVCEAMIRLVIADAIAHQQLIENHEPSLDNLREAIDRIDEDILLALWRRDRIVEKIGEIKKEMECPVYDPEREETMMKALEEKATAWNIDKKLVKRVWEAIVEHSRRKQ